MAQHVYSIGVLCVKRTSYIVDFYNVTIEIAVAAYVPIFHISKTCIILFVIVGRDFGITRVSFHCANLEAGMA